MSAWVCGPSQIPDQSLIRVVLKYYLQFASHHHTLWCFDSNRYAIMPQKIVWIFVLYIHYIIGGNISQCRRCCIEGIAHIVKSLKVFMKNFLCSLRSSNYAKNTYTKAIWRRPNFRLLPKSINSLDQLSWWFLGQNVKIY